MEKSKIWKRERGRREMEKIRRTGSRDRKKSQTGRKVTGRKEIGSIGDWKRKVERKKKKEYKKERRRRKKKRHSERNETGRRETWRREKEKESKEPC